MNLGLLIHHHATVYIKRLSSDVVGRWRREENHRLGDIFGLAHAGNGQPLNAIVKAASHLCLYWSWAHRVSIFVKASTPPFAVA